ncbi:MAG: DUF4426 domain-containing protein [Pseudomonadota bacterium]
MRTFRAVALVFALTLAAGCGPGSSSLEEAPVARPLAPTSKDFGDYVVHFNAISSSIISPEDAAKYGIARSRSSALLNVVMLSKDGAPGHTPVSGDVLVKVTNLTGQVKNIAMKRVTEGRAIYYIGEVAVTNDERLNFNIEATPEGKSRPLTIKHQQQFFTR